jgi:hypothetical protein
MELVGIVGFFGSARKRVIGVTAKEIGSCRDSRASGCSIVGAVAGRQPAGLEA